MPVGPEVPRSRVSDDSATLWVLDNLGHPAPCLRLSSVRVRMPNGEANRPVAYVSVCLCVNPTASG